jgi:hypothetical protein
MKSGRHVAIFVLALAGLVFLLAPSSAFAQSCALCYTQAASSGSRMIQALRSGILILIAPPTFGTVGLIFICYRKRHQTRDSIDDDFDREWNQDKFPYDFSRKDW